METDSSKKNIVFTGGGSGGHVFPNKPLIDYYKDKYNIIYFGTKTGMEREIVNGWGIKFETITSGKLRRYFDLKNIVDVFRVFVGIFEALYKLAKYKPVFIFSKGGFVSVPVCIAGKLLSVPVYIHEADMTPGLANRIASIFATRLFLTFAPKTEPKVSYTVSGLPMRSEIYNATPQKGKEYLEIKNQKPVLLVMGGSLGATNINNLVIKNIDVLLNIFNVVHITGRGKIDNGLNLEDYTQKEFIQDEIFNVIAAADVVVSRAGSNSIMELLTLKKPTMFIPLTLEQSRGDQLENVEYLKPFNICEIVYERELTDEIFVSKALELLEKKETFIENINKLLLPNAVEEIVNVIQK